MHIRSKVGCGNCQLKFKYFECSKLFINYSSISVYFYGIKNEDT